MVPCDHDGSQNRETPTRRGHHQRRPRSVLEDCAPNLDMGRPQRHPHPRHLLRQQIMAQRLGGKRFSQGTNREYGKRRIRCTEARNSQLGARGIRSRSQGQGTRSQRSGIPGLKVRLNDQGLPLRSPDARIGIKQQISMDEHGGRCPRSPTDFTVKEITNANRISDGGEGRKTVLRGSKRFSNSTPKSPTPSMDKTISTASYSRKPSSREMDQRPPEKLIEDHSHAQSPSGRRGRCLRVRGACRLAVMDSLLIKAIGRKSQ